MRNHSEKYFPIVENYLNSGSTIKTFCEGNGLSQNVLLYWKKKYLNKDLPVVKGFAPLLVEEKKNECFAAIHYPDGTRLIFENAINVPLLKQFLPAFAK